ncbi:hypothetical protein N9920_01215 [Akkermansiaceae bacterium]|nr:hypothetical protein [Akkermansiaceae bacterium]MDB4318500.1 hypothetical protein [bacterium]MDB4258120.1 hypothetical protein [Akkermansiaceae bacterium]MDB4312769.1 hypothetical protein [Akkermansiaceae bacterium]MDB4325590.1 hypothetical protein [Akkermansiaceae bacterium]
MQREVKPEILDELTGDDPRALRSRRDLRLINFLMGNERWILRQLSVGEKLVELGAGAGDFTRQLAKKNEVIGLDFQGPPQDLERNWKEGDLFQTLPEAEGGVVIANLILHHFKEEGLARLGELLKGRDRLVIVEPWRSRLALAEGYGLFPFVNDVTRHDMMVSIRAGFRRGELARLLNLGDEWEWREEVSLLGGIRVLAWRR